MSNLESKAKTLGDWSREASAKVNSVEVREEDFRNESTEYSEMIYAQEYGKKLVSLVEAQKLESKLEEIFSKMHDLQVDYLDKMACDDECKRKRELDTFREQWFKLWSNDIDIVASKLTQANRTIEAANKKLELNDHNAKVLLKVADNEIARLKALVYCQCKEPNYNKFGMDNQCARCRKPIENHPLSLSQEPTSKHYVDVQGMDENLKSDLDHCFCPICNHRAVQTCIDEKCTCCITSVANGVQEEKTELP